MPDENSNAPQPVLNAKLVFVGDEKVGKTTIIEALKGNKVDFQKYEPTQYDAEGWSLAISEFHPHKVQIFDTSGQEELDRLRSLTYQDAHLVVICFSVVDWGSFNRLEERWSNFVRHFPGIRKNCPFILVATKINLRENEEELKKLKGQNKTAITRAEGEEKAKQLEAAAYLECDPNDRESILEIIRQSILVVLDRKAEDESTPVSKERKKLKKRLKGGKCIVQ